MAEWAIVKVMNREQRRKVRKSQTRLAFLTAAGMVGSSISFAVPVNADPSPLTLSASNCGEVDTQLSALVASVKLAESGTAGVLNLEFTDSSGGPCLNLGSHLIDVPLTINGPSSGNLTLSTPLGVGTALTTVAKLDINNLNFGTGAAVTSFIQGDSGSDITLNNVTFHDAEASVAAVGIYSEGHLQVSNSRFYNLTSATGSAAIFLDTRSTASIDSSAFDDNVGSGEIHGGTVSAFSSTLTITGSSFSHNSNTRSSGGAIQTIGLTISTISTSDFTSNTAYNKGGAISIDQGSSLSVDHSSFNSNSLLSGAVGGGAIHSESALTVGSSTFFDNKAEAGVGGAIYVPYGAPEVDNSTFVDNYAADGGALFAEGGIVSNSTFWNNEVQDNTGNPIAASIVFGGKLFASILTNEDATPVLQNGATDLGANLFTDSSFTPTTTGIGLSKMVTFASLKLKSLALFKTLPNNSGTTMTVAIGTDSIARNYYTETSPGALDGITQNLLADIDQRGVARPFGSGYDVGAFERGGEPEPDPSESTETTPSESPTPTTSESPKTSESATPSESPDVEVLANTGVKTSSNYLGVIGLGFFAILSGCAGLLRRRRKS